MILFYENVYFKSTDTYPRKEGRGKLITAYICIWIKIAIQIKNVLHLIKTITVLHFIANKDQIQQWWILLFVVYPIK